MSFEHDKVSGEELLRGMALLRANSIAAFREAPCCLLAVQREVVRVR